MESGEAPAKKVNGNGKGSSSSSMEEKDAAHAQPSQSQARETRPHNRTYYHSATWNPIHPNELDEDSEGEVVGGPEWFNRKTSMMVEEFADVNEGEKGIMKMWNLHITERNYVGDYQIPTACKVFVENFGKEIFEQNLYGNFVLHMTNLFDFGLLTAPEFHDTVVLMQARMMAFAKDCKDPEKKARCFFT